MRRKVPACCGFSAVSACQTGQGLQGLQALKQKQDRDDATGCMTRPQTNNNMKNCFCDRVGQCVSVCDNVTKTLCDMQNLLSIMELHKIIIETTAIAAHGVPTSSFNPQQKKKHIYGTVFLLLSLVNQKTPSSLAHSKCKNTEIDVAQLLQVPAHPHAMAASCSKRLAAQKIRKSKAAPTGVV